MTSDAYLSLLEDLLRRAREANRVAVATAAEIIADAVQADGIVHAFGSGHSQLLAMDLAGRAGGLACVQVIFDPGYGKAETLEGYARTLLQRYRLERRDCLIVISNSGRNAAPIEVAQLGREAGLRVIGATGMQASRAAPSRHSSGKRLYELADVVLDLGSAPGDAAIALDGVRARAGPTSTIVGAALLNAVMVTAVALLGQRGVDAPVFLSQNVDGSQAHNAALRERYRGRISGIM